jgi:hypothetical protein
MTTFASPTLSGDYQSLCNAVADELNRQDLTASIPNFVALANSRASRDLSALRHQGSICETLLTLSDAWTDLPAGFQSLYQLTLPNGGPSQYLSPEDMRLVMQAAHPTPAGAIYYSIIGDGLMVYPAPTASTPLQVDIWFYANLPPLNAQQTNHWALVRYPDLFFYGALVHSAPYLKADERIQTWEAAYQAILTTISIEASRGNTPQSFLTARARGF